MKYVMLLRGVNVGGRRSVPRAEFKAALERLGFYDVSIYINSGNAVFTADIAPDVAAVQNAFEATFGFDVPMLILSASKIQAIADAIPSDWTNDPIRPDKSGLKSDVIYLFDEINTPDIIQKMGHKPDIETMLYVDGAVLTMVPRAHQSKSSLPKIIGGELYAYMTVRNVNTARKLAELAR